MLTETRWCKEQELMKSVFPQFKPYTQDSEFGFEGYLKGPRSGRMYRVLLRAEQLTYPQFPPSVCVEPRIGEHWVERRGWRALCAIRNWQPARSTFANTLLVLIRYLDEHDGLN
ncbi:MAG: hypothetical protein ACE15B_08065 [Bryobacteraceae bacterium]